MDLVGGYCLTAGQHRCVFIQLSKAFLTNWSIVFSLAVVQQFSFMVRLRVSATGKNLPRF